MLRLQFEALAKSKFSTACRAFTVQRFGCHGDTEGNERKFCEKNVSWPGSLDANPEILNHLGDVSHLIN